ncbi:unnamed protein product [Ostreobium quekettii]|uniref:Uncharacterized protein n=1 Tax=Ostreobium quekettii TaxID=121088 RepID=A0A8S1IPB0_9CHLO|nr:unnamed protein product [Ostreobium quekettii]
MAMPVGKCGSCGGLGPGAMGRGPTKAEPETFFWRGGSPRCACSRTQAVRDWAFGLVSQCRQVLLMVALVPGSALDFAVDGPSVVALEFSLSSEVWKLLNTIALGGKRILQKVLLLRKSTGLCLFPFVLIQRNCRLLVGNLRLSSSPP